MITIDIANDFSRFPGGRRKKDGPASGEEFRARLKRHLEASTDKIRIILNGTEGYPTSFLEEAFGGLVRDEGFGLEQLRERLDFVADAEYQPYVDDIWTFIQEAAAATRH
jgi:hypothetical protein